MTDVRLTATTPEGDVVPLLANSKGEMLLEAPIAPPEFDGNLDGKLTVSGDAAVGDNVNGSGGVDLGGCYFGKEGYISLNKKQDETDIPFFMARRFGTNKPLAEITPTGGANFKGDVVIGSRGATWLIRESNGVAMLIEQTLTKEAPEEVRNLPRELDLIEAALNEVMDKLKMTPPAGWEVWDGSDNSQ